MKTSTTVVDARNVEAYPYRYLSCEDISGGKCYIAILFICAEAFQVVKPSASASNEHSPIG
jgi:hypothetical protein